MTKNIVNIIDDNVKIKNLLVSVSDKSGLDTFIPAIANLNPEIKIFSTGGTYSAIKDILIKNATMQKKLSDSEAIEYVEKILEQVSDYTGQPETQGGLVKTLDFKIYLGLLTETYNEFHQNDLERTNAVAIDMVVVNLYPFKETISKHNITFENARGNIDIGGPTMIRASAKNFIRVASVVDPADYSVIIENMKSGNGGLNLEQRFNLARKAFEHTAIYDITISDYLRKLTFEQVKSCYRYSN